jgi:hypothetical protein
MLLAAVLSPTAQVLASAIMGREEVPYRLRRLLNVESGVNDGLALPVIVFLLSYLGLGPEEQITGAALEVGVTLGVVVPWRRSRRASWRYSIRPADTSPFTPSQCGGDRGFGAAAFFHGCVGGRVV